jgi:hypothetical protein
LKWRFKLWFWNEWVWEWNKGWSWNDLAKFGVAYGKFNGLKVRWSNQGGSANANGEFDFSAMASMVVGKIANWKRWLLKLDIVGGGGRKWMICKIFSQPNTLCSNS